MNKKIKVIIASIALVGVLSTGASLAFGASEKGSQIDTNDIIRLTTSNNSELNLFKKKIEVKDKWYHEALKEKDNESNYAEDMRKYVNPFRRELEIDELEWQRDQKQDEVVLAATKLYYDIMLQDEMIELQKKKIQRLGKLVEYKKAKIEIGTESSVSLIDDETNLKDATTNLTKLENDKERLKMQLNMKIGNPVTKDITLKKVDIPYKVFEVANLENVVENMLKKYHTITYMEEEQKIDIKEKDIVHDYANASTNTAIENAMNPSSDYEEKEEELEDSLTELTYKMDDEKKRIDSKIRMDYNNILNLKDDVALKELDYEKTQTMLQTEKAKLDAGTSTILACDAKEEETLNALYNYNKAKLDYYIATEEFKNFTKKVL